MARGIYGPLVPLLDRYNVYLVQPRWSENTKVTPFDQMFARELDALGLGKERPSAEEGRQAFLRHAKLERDGVV